MHSIHITLSNEMGDEMGDAGAFVALFRYHGPFLSNEGHLFVLFQDILPHQRLNALSLLFYSQIRQQSPRVRN